MITPPFLKINGELYINSFVVSLISISSLISGRCIKNIGIIPRSQSIFYFEGNRIIYYLLHLESEINNLLLDLIYYGNLKNFLVDILRSYYSEYILTKNDC